MATEDMDKNKFVIQCKVCCSSCLLVFANLCQERATSSYVSFIFVTFTCSFQGKLMLLSKFEVENPFFKRYLSEGLHVFLAP